MPAQRFAPPERKIRHPVPFHLVVGDRRIADVIEEPVHRVQIRWNRTWHVSRRRRQGRPTPIAHQGRLRERVGHHVGELESVAV